MTSQAGENLLRGFSGHERRWSLRGHHLAGSRCQRRRSVWKKKKDSALKRQKEQLDKKSYRLAGGVSKKGLRRSISAPTSRSFRTEIRRCKE